jgi:hypothetical protein
MSAKKAGSDKNATTVMAKNPQLLKGMLKCIGGSQSDHWNHNLVDQAFQSLWLKHSDKDKRDRQFGATLGAAGSYRTERRNRGHDRGPDHRRA